MKKIDINNFLNLKIPVQKIRVLILAVLVIVIALWCLVLPPIPVEPLMINNYQGKNTISTSQEPSIMAESNAMLNYWDLPIFKEEQVVKPKVIKPKVIEKKQELIPIPPEVPSIPPQVSLPLIQYMGQILDKEQKVNIFLKVGEENLILAPNVPYNNTWIVLENSPYQVVVQYIPDQRIMTISK
ncbi:hypothetical protein [Acinetobacter sp. RW6]|uniref:hypothetical protein n=1 Tax=Acinetobacter sp. RW6 TaxID=3242680 RepID=UPI0035BF83C8